MSDLPTRNDLEQRRVRYLDPGSPFKASVAVVEHGARAMVVKDLRPMWPLLRLTYGRWMQARELRALRRVQGFAGAPHLIGVIDRDAFAEAMIEGQHFSRALDPALLPRIFANLELTIAGLHERGIVHLDLREKKNILITGTGDTVILDFESALRFGTGPLGRALTRLLARLDRSALIKFKAKLAPELLTGDELKRLKRVTLLARLWFVKDLVGLVKRLFFRRRREP